MNTFLDSSWDLLWAVIGRKSVVGVFFFVSVLEQFKKEPIDSFSYLLAELQLSECSWLSLS